VLFGQAGIERDDDDFFAAYLLNETLACDKSRLREVRENAG
jgi:zinc protease